MNRSRPFWRASFFLILLAALCGSFAFPVNYVPVSAAPQMQAANPPSVVISEFRFLGPQGGNDEFIELYNPTSTAIDISGWLINGSNNAGSTNTRATIPVGTILPPGGYYLIANNATNGYSGTVAPNLTYGSGITDDGGIAVFSNATTIVDQVGLSSGSSYKEGTPLSPLLSGTADQSYERKSPGELRNCTDTDNNAADFARNASSSNPQNSSSPAVTCLYVMNVNASPSYDFPPAHTSPTSFDITVTFSGTVFVSGIPSLLLETGAVDSPASYSAGEGTDTLTFTYNADVGDSSMDLDYVSSTALSGAIFDAIGNANLTLPNPGAVNSLGANRNIQINIDDGQPPRVLSIKRQNPTTTPTRNDNLTFRVAFSENVLLIDAADFAVHPNSPQPTTTASVTSVTSVSGSGNLYDVMISGGDLAGFDGIVGLDLSSSATIEDEFGNSIVLPENLSTTNDETYLVDNTGPSVTVNQTTAQSDPTSATPVNFTVVFSEPIVVSTFTTTDITQPASPGAITWTISNPSNDRRTFNLVATAISVPNVVLTPSIAATANITDDAGNTNSDSTSTDNSVTFTDTTRPSVTIARASGQAASTTVLPVRFTVTFSEAINVATFTPADIIQSATSSPASGITWTISDSGDHRTFTISATAVAVVGNITPHIAANAVTDLVGNGNTVTTSTATVNYGVPTTPTTPASVVINEVAWSGTAARTDDEWIELRNATTSDIDITGWTLHGDNNVSGQVNTPNITLSGIIPAGGYFLIEREEAATTAPANQVASSIDLLNGGERLILRDSSGTTIDTANSDGGSWPAGTAAVSGQTPLSYASMERVGTTNTWVTYAGTVHIADDRDGDPVHGTPGGQNWIATASVTTITSDLPDPSLISDNVTVRVTVVGGPSTPTGTVSITGANTNCTMTLSNGSGSCIVKFTSTGSKTIRATYNGDGSHPASSDTEPHSVSATSRTPTVTRVPTLPPPPPLVAINEFVPRPGHDWNGDGAVNVEDEFIEIINHGVINVNLSGYSLDDEANIGSSPYRLPSVTIVPGERIVFYGSETGLLLSDGGDGVRLLKPNGQLADAYNYSVARYPDQSYCRLPDNGGLDDWNQNCFPTPGLQNSLSGGAVAPPSGSETLLCPIADTLPEDFVIAECAPFGNNIWRRAFWDETGWYGEKLIPGIERRWDVFAD